MEVKNKNAAGPVGAGEAAAKIEELINSNFADEEIVLHLKYSSREA